MKKETYECLYVIWWTTAVVVAAILALWSGFPHSLLFVPVTGGWLAAWMILGVLVDLKSEFRFSEGAFPFGPFRRLLSAKK
ncbi:MAG: hypothetical protein U1D30_11885 [Planctomycetota bacterium]